MINFEKEFEAMLRDDPLGLLKEKPKTSSVISSENRLKASFEEINQFVDTKRREPKKSRDINERRLFSRLQGFRESPEKAAMLLEQDRHGLLEGVEAPEPFIVESIEDVLDADPLGLLGGSVEGDEPNIFDLAGLPEKPRALTDFVAKRKPCKDFQNYEDQFHTVQQEIKESKRKLIHFTDKGEAIVEGNYYILGGILLYLENIYWGSEEKTVDGKRYRKDGRTRCIFENGTESNMLYRSLAKALYHGGKIVTQTEDQINSGFNKNFSGIAESDELLGHIYVLKSLSENPEIKIIKDLYKIGFSTVPVKERIANAENETTYLMSAVKTMAVFDLYKKNAYVLSAKDIEKLIHSFFAEVCVDLKVADNKGKIHQPREWFIVPYDVIVQVIELIANEQIVHYQYDAQLKKVVTTN